MILIPGKKKFLSSALFRTGAHRFLRLGAKGSLIVFNYHRIRGDEKQSTSFDDIVFGPSAEEFRRHLRWLRKEADLLSEGDLIGLLRSGRKPPRRGAMITFDDGYRDNFEYALPILKELEVPATFFVPTEAISLRQLGWWDLIAYLVKKADRGEIQIRGERFVVPLKGERGALIQRLHEKMQLGPRDETSTLVAELAQSCDVGLPETAECSAELMTWEQVRAAAASGVVTIGSHTHSHRVLSTLDLESQRLELQRSKVELESRIGATVHSIAYPVGGYEHFHLETKRLAHDCGYRLGFSFQTGVNRHDGIDPFDVRRLGAPESVALMAATLSLPGIFGKRKCDLSGPRRAL